MVLRCALKKRKEKQPFSRRFPSVFWKLKEKRVFQRARRTPRGTGSSDRLWLTAGSTAAVERKSEKPGINHGTSIKQERRVLLAQGGPSLGVWLGKWWSFWGSYYIDWLDLLKTFLHTIKSSSSQLCLLAVCSLLDFCFFSICFLQSSDCCSNFCPIYCCRKHCH